MLIISLKNNKKKVLQQTIKILREKGLVVFPSDTVYGLLCDATNEIAVKKLIEFKNRPPGKAISVFCNFEMLNQLVTINDQQLTILNQIFPGPFTVILPSRHKVSKSLESEKGTLGIRIPQYQLINQLIQEYKKPVTATSANLANRPSHYSIKTLLNELSEKQKQMIDLVVDFGLLPKNKPSTVVSLTQPDIKILRKGDIVFGKPKTYISSTPEETEKIGKFILEKNLTKTKPLIFIIEGELGVGKTVLIKGMGKKLGIDNIVSPTYVIYYEYGNFYHFDLYQVENKEEFKYLEIEKLLKPGNILCFEWGEKAGEIYEMLKNRAKVVYIKMKYISEKKREIRVNI